MEQNIRINEDAEIIFEINLGQDWDLVTFMLEEHPEPQIDFEKDHWTAEQALRDIIRCQKISIDSLEWQLKVLKDTYGF